MTNNADTIEYAANGGISNISTDIMKIDLPLHNDPAQHYENTEVEFPVISPKLQAKTTPKKLPVRYPVSSPIYPSYETYTSNENDHFRHFMKPLD